MYQDLLNDRSTGKDIVFTSGGPGSGKTSGIEKITKLQGLVDNAGLVYDGVFDKLNQNSNKIDQALKAGKSVHVMFVYRDPSEAFRNGILRRANRQERESGSGRAMPISYTAKVYAKIQREMEATREKYKDNPRVHFNAVDNSGGPGQAKEVDFNQLPLDESEEKIAAKMHKILDEEYAAGRVSKKLYDGTNR